MAIIELKKPIKVDGEEKTSLSYDLDALTGDDIQKATRELNKLGIVPVTSVEVDCNYQAALFAISAGLDVADMNRLGAKDYARCTRVVRDFFLDDTEE